MVSRDIPFPQKNNDAINQPWQSQFRPEYLTLFFTRHTSSRGVWDVPDENALLNLICKHFGRTLRNFVLD
jgi:hypothetical protein